MDTTVIILSIAALFFIYTIIRVFIALIKSIASIIYGFVKCKTPVTATVTDRLEQRVEDGGTGTDKEYSYCYQFTLNGNVYTVRSKKWSFVPYRVGSTVKLYVDESNPNHIFERGMILLNVISNLLIFVIIIGASIYVVHILLTLINTRV